MPGRRHSRAQQRHRAVSVGDGTSASGGAAAVGIGGATAPGFDAPISHRRRMQLRVAQVRLKTITTGLVAITAGIVAGLALALHLVGRVVLVNNSSTTEGAIVVGNVALALSWLTAVPAAILLDGYLLPRHGIVVALMLATVLAAALMASTFPTIHSPSHAQRVFDNAVASMSTLLLAMAGGAALYVALVALANVQEKALRINRTLELALVAAVGRANAASAIGLGGPRVGGDNSGRGSPAVPLQEASTPAARAQHVVHAWDDGKSPSGRSPQGPTGGATGGADQTTFTETVIEYGLLERATWFTDGPMWAFIATYAAATFASSVFVVATADHVSPFILSAVIALPLATALLVAVGIGRSLPRTLSAIPTIDELLLFQQPATGKQQQGGGAGGAGVGENSSSAAMEHSANNAPPAPHVYVVYSGTAAFEVLWRRLAGEGDATLEVVYGRQALIDVDLFYRIARYTLPLIAAAISKNSLCATLDGVAVMQDRDAFKENLDAGALVATWEGAGALFGLLLAYGAFRFANRKRTSGGGAKPARRLPIGPRALAVVGYVLMLLASIVTLAILAQARGHTGDENAWGASIIAPAALLQGAGGILVFSATLALCWSSVAPSLRVYSIAIVAVAYGLGALARNWAPWNPYSVTARYWVHAGIAVACAVVALGLQALLMASDRGRIIDEGALIGRQITPDFGEERFVLESRLRGGASQPGSMLRRAAIGRESGYGATELR